MGKRKVLITAFILISAGLLTVFGIVSKKQAPLNSVASELSDINGQSVNFADFRGKVVFVNNWASWL